MATADIVINNGDSVGEGFNDPTITTPAGGNAAHTLGQARLNAFRHAALLVDGMVSSPVTIRVDAEMNPLPGDATSAVLGGASPTEIMINFPGAPHVNTWYVAALANALNGTDLSASDDIQAQFNSAVDGNVVLGTYHWYYGYDKPANLAVEFLPTVQHEIIHGLGFLTLLNEFGQPYAGYNDAYMLYLEDHDNVPPDFPSMSDSERAVAMIDAGNLHWVGPNVRAAAPGLLSEGIDNRTIDHVQMYAPNPYQSGSSTSHFDISLNPDELMEPYLTDNPETILAAALLKDIGWTIDSNSPSLPQADLSIVAADTATAGQYQLTVTNNDAINSAPYTTVTLVIPSNINITSSTASQGSCSTLGSLLRCDLGTLDPSQSAGITITLIVTNCAVTSVTYNVSAPYYDPNTSNNNDAITSSSPNAVFISSSSITEGDSGQQTINFDVSICTAPNNPVTMNYATEDGTATAGLDYIAASGSLIIPAGTTSVSIPVSITGDTEYEGNETFNVRLSNISANAVLGQAVATGTINNDDNSFSGGGGGGSMGLLLAGLLPLLFRRRTTLQ